ncbi:hypothetical protein ABPG74_022553 [Tetrahymena malaccensis]
MQGFQKISQSPQRMQAKKDSSLIVGQVKSQQSAAACLVPSDSAVINSVDLVPFYTLYNFIKAKTAKETISKNSQINTSHNNQMGTRRDKSANNSASKERANSGSAKHGLKNKSISPSTQKKTSAALMSTLKQKLKNQNSQNGLNQIAQKKQHNQSSIQYNNNSNTNQSLGNQYFPQQPSISSIIQQQCQQINRQNMQQQFQSTSPYLQSNQKHTNSSGIESIENLLSATTNKNTQSSQDSKYPLKNSLSTSNMNNQSDNKSQKKKQQLQNNSIAQIYGKHSQQNYHQNQQQQIQQLAQMTSHSISSSSQRKTTSNKNLQVHQFGNQQLSQQQLAQIQYQIQSSTDSSSSLNLNQIQGISTLFKYDQLYKRIDTFWSSNMYSYQTDETNMKNYFDSLFGIFEEYKNQLDMKLVDILFKVFMNPIQKMIIDLDKLNEDKSKLLKDNEERRNEARQLLQQVEILQHKNDQQTDILKQIQDHQFHSPLLEKLFTENQKLSKLLAKQKHKLHELRKKDEKVMKLLYFIRKEGIDVDKIYKLHMQTPRNETSSEEDSFMLMNENNFDDLQQSSHQNNFINHDQLEEQNGLNNEEQNLIDNSEQNVINNNNNNNNHHKIYNMQGIMIQN